MIVCTAGHIDHGKTALVKALTGADDDRPAEERKRSTQIDPDCVYLDRPDGSSIGFIDVPGPDHFMQNLLVGAAGIDLLLLVVAADEGVMPQTREHLALAELLGLRRGLVALSKCDLVGPERREEVSRQIATLTGTGCLEGARIIPVSAATADGVPALLAALDAAARLCGAQEDTQAVRFAVDRTDSLQGTGTVTGVVWSGELSPGDTLIASPQGIETRVSGFQVRDKPASGVARGERCAINLAGQLKPSDLRAGNFLIDPTLHAPTDRMDAEIRLLPEEPRSLRQWTAVRLHHGAAEVAARIALLQDGPVAPGEEGQVQIVLERQVAAAVGDRFVLRDAGGKRILGGGRLIDLHPPQRRRRQPRRLAQLAAMAIRDPAGSLAAQLSIWPWHVEQERFRRDRALSEAAFEAVLAKVPHRRAAGEEATLLFSEEVWHRLQDSALAALEEFHRRFPQLPGPTFQRFSASLSPHLSDQAAEAFLIGLAECGVIIRESGLFRLPTHKPALGRGDREIWQTLSPHLDGRARFRPPRVADLAEISGRQDSEVRRVLQSMSSQGTVVEIVTDHFFLRTALTEIARIVGELARNSEGGSFGAAQLRDRLSNGRKVAIQILEYFDRQGLTLRCDDRRTVDPGQIERFAEGQAASDE